MVYDYSASSAIEGRHLWNTVELENSLERAHANSLSIQITELGGWSNKQYQHWLDSQLSEWLCRGLFLELSVRIQV